MKEKNIFYLIIFLFLGFYFMPTGNSIFTGAILSGFSLLHDYAQQHILTCLVPAFFIAGAVSVFVKKDAILKYLGSKSKKYISYSIASVSGAVLAVCSCTILPLFAGIRQRGAGLGPAVTFLFSGPAINIAAIFLTMSVLGYDIGIARMIFAITLSIVIGLLMSIIFREKPGEGGFFVQEEKSEKLGKNVMLAFFASMVLILVVNGIAMDVMLKYALMGGLAVITGAIAYLKFERKVTREWLVETWNFSKLLLPYLFIGVFIAGFIMPLLPQSLIEYYVGENSVAGNLIASIFGAFMYFSTLTEIPIIQALMAKGMSNGPALALLLAGPSLSLPNMLIVRRVLGNKKTAVYVTLVIAFSTLAGLFFGSFY